MKLLALYLSSRGTLQPSHVTGRPPRLYLDTCIISGIAREQFGVKAMLPTEILETLRHT
jgi:hypothetical protein